MYVNVTTTIIIFICELNLVNNHDTNMTTKHTENQTKNIITFLVKTYRVVWCVNMHTKLAPNIVQQKKSRYHGNMMTRSKQRWSWWWWYVFRNAKKNELNIDAIGLDIFCLPGKMIGLFVDDDDDIHLMII